MKLIAYVRFPMRRTQCADGPTLPKAARFTFLFGGGGCRVFDSEATARDWIGSRLIGPDSHFAPNGFEASVTVYRIQMRGSFLASLINGVQEMTSFSAPSGRYRYNELVRQVAQVTGREPAFWFYVTDPDNCLSVVNWVHACNYECALDSPLSSFETELAVQGGVSRLGLVGGSGQWLLLHEYHSDEEFSISFYGLLTICNELRRLLRCSDGEFPDPGVGPKHGSA